MWLTLVTVASSLAIFSNPSSEVCMLGQALTV
ncbi:hypothetical protein LINPERHAP1_LOCUS8168 [Linum perenne]